MIEHHVTQGSPEWLRLRATTYNASEAAAMMGCSPYMTRSELLRLKHGGLPPEVDPATQRLYDEGHRVEAAYLPHAEALVGDELFQLVGTLEIDGMVLLASFDGLTLDHRIGFEYKLHSAANVQALEETGEPPIHHIWQLEQQLLVSGAGYILYATGDGTLEGTQTCIYSAQPGRRAALLAGWRQFHADLASYVPPPAVDVPVAKPVAALPVVFDMRVEGRLLACNLDRFKPAALAYIDGINTVLSSDQSFADAEADAKFCRESASKLKLSIEQALGQMGDINAALAAVRDIAAAFDSKGLTLEKLVKARKEELRSGIVQEAQAKLREHLRALSASVGLTVSATTADFAGAVKGKRTLASLHDAVDTELAQAKIAANELAERMRINLKSMSGISGDWSFLFPDIQAVADKAPEDFANLLAARMQKHQQAEAARRAREAQQAEDELRAMQAAADARAAQVANEAALARARAAAAQPVQPAAEVQQAPLTLSQINAMLAPLAVSQSALSQLGFEPVGRQRSAVLYHAADFAAICEAIAGHALAVADAQVESEVQP